MRNLQPLHSTVSTAIWSRLYKRIHFLSRYEYVWLENKNANAYFLDIYFTKKLFLFIANRYL